ncbi:cytochrome P450 [Imleria badia]|nr:cytochrome P450 [Imleria badia]
MDSAHIASAYVPYLLGGAVCYLADKRLFAVPEEIRHIPQAPILPTLLSFARGEVEDVRIKKLLLPYAQRGEPAVLMYALDRWIIHVLDSKIAKDMFADPVTYPKEVPPDGLLLWRFVGYSNVILSNGPAWKRHSKIIKAALDRNLPVEKFGLLAQKLFKQMGKGGLLHWDDLTMRYALDAVGTTALGHDFNAVGDPNNPFVKQYNHVMKIKSFQELLAIKKENPCNDMLTYMLEDKEMTDMEYRDNMVFFIVGHNTTAGAMASLCYFLAINPEMQARARAEVRAAMTNNTSGIPTVAELREMPFLQACIRESFRVNTPITYVVPRTATEDVQLRSSDNKDLFIPRGSSIINVTTIHYRDDYWQNPCEFDPDRFMGLSEGMEKAYDATEWLPFALGQRQCPARNFAMYEQRTLGAMLLNEWGWTLPKDSPHQDGLKNGFSPFAPSLPKDLYLDFKRCDKP